MIMNLVLSLAIVLISIIVIILDSVFWRCADTRMIG